MPFVLTNDETDEGPVLETHGFRGSSDSPWWDPGSMLPKIPSYVILVQRALREVNDLPRSTVAAPIWSTRLRQAIESAGPVDLEIVPAVIHDAPEPTEVREDYSLVHVLTEVHGAVDPSGTDVTTYSFGPQWKTVRRFRLHRTPAQAAWRLVELPTYVMVSDRAAAAIRAAGVRGVALVAPEDFRL
jgi:hypothetical protein